jgi:hypothetical protein
MNSNEYLKIKISKNSTVTKLNLFLKKIKVFICLIHDLFIIIMHHLSFIYLPTYLPTYLNTYIYLFFSFRVGIFQANTCQYGSRFNCGMGYGLVSMVRAGEIWIKSSVKFLKSEPSACQVCQFLVNLGFLSQVFKISESAVCFSADPFPGWKLLNCFALPSTAISQQWLKVISYPR